MRLLQNSIAASIISLLLASVTHAGGLTYVNYSIRENPEDPDSDVLFKIALGLNADDIKTNGVYWEIQELVIVEVGTGQEEDKFWSEWFPLVDTPDGLWWVEHADTNDPQAEEFHSPPLVVGTALAHDASDPDLDYDVEGIEYVTPPGQLTPYEGRVSSLTHTIVQNGQTQSESEGDEDPGEVEPPDSEPPYAHS